jgi:folate-binding protein YgfZ
MTAITSIPLPGRGVLAVRGPEARTFLQGLVTNDVTRVNPARAIYAALLTPQGKFLFDFLIADDGAGGMLFDTDRERLPELAKRLTFYKLRSKVEIADLSGELAVTALVGDGAAARAKLVGAAGNAWRLDGSAVFVDPRLAPLGVRMIHSAGSPAPFAGDQEGTADDYEALRLGLGVPEAGRDVLVDKSFILESNFEELNAIDFDKGCYVGQELTARTKHRGKVRKRLFRVDITGDAPPAGTPIMAGEAEIGELRSGKGSTAIALIRIDRLEEAAENGEALLADGVAVTPVKPEWANF